MRHPLDASSHPRLSFPPMPKKALAALCLLIPVFAAAAPLTKEEVPAPLQSWVQWVLRGREHELCASYNMRGDRACDWPGPLKLVLTDKGGRFEQAFTLQAAEWALLPGSSERWPQDVRVDGAPAVVLRRGDTPALRLKPGAHQVSGSFAWDRLPDQLTIPQETAILELSLRGQAVPFPNRDEAGRLWMQARGAEKPVKEEARLEVSVHRRLVDDQPMELVTRLQLKVSGVGREVVLGPVLPDGFAPMSLASPLPAKLDAEGRLRVQVRAGAWDVYVNARKEKRGDEVKLDSPKGAWTANEVWVYEARPQLRLADLSGAPSLDPQQTELPPPWKSFPTYLVKPGSTLKLVERQRGEDPRAPDRLTVNRELWLDFSGRGFSARDHISGTLKRSWRLEASPEVALGRASVAGQDQFLTVAATGAPAGLEVRVHGLDVTADSRIEGRRLTASGWAHDVESLSATVHLPPGWKIFHAGGVDQAYPTWITRWTLLDFFLVLVAAAALGRLFSPAWGVAAALGLALAWHEPGAPRWLWLLAILCAALARALEGHEKASRYLLIARRAVWAGLALVLIPFTVQQLRWALYPDLAPPAGSVHPRGQGAFQPGAGGAGEGGEYDGSNVPQAAPAEPAAIDELQEAKDQAMQEQERRELGLKKAARGMISGAASSMADMASLRAPKQRYDYKSNYTQMQMELDPNARVTTGAGLPYWDWTTARLTWKGPVPKGHVMSLWLIGPRLGFILTLARLTLVILLALLLAGLPVGDWLRRLREPGGASGLGRAMLPLLLLLVASGARAAETAFPPREILDDLRNRLLEQHECFPNCAESPRARLKATDAWLSVSLEIQAQALTAVPIPSSGREWTPARATLDGKPAGVRRGPDGSLWAAVPAGAHVLAVEGALPERDSVQIALPLRPMRMETSVSGWSVSGVREDGRPEDAIQLSRTRAARAASIDAREQGVFPPFLRVVRIVRLGLSWTVETQVLRMTPGGQAVTASIPLLPGEAVTSSDLRVVNGKVQFTLPPQSAGGGWVSTLAQTDKLKLSAPETALWGEEWRVEPGPMWHVEASGVPRLPDGGGARAMVYRPWPGEAVDVEISRPGATKGQTLTIDEAVLTLSPGVRATDAELQLSLRSSRGGQHPITLPEGAELLWSRVDGADASLQLEKGKLVVPVAPGSHQVQAAWRQPGGARAFFRAPKVDVGSDAVNLHVLFNMPQGRWTLALGGPGMGPAVLFWALLAVFLLVSIGLAKTELAPLDWKHWFLLSIGLTQVGVVGGAIVAGWFLAVGARARRAPQGEREFKLGQAFLIFLTFVAAAFLFKAIKAGLLGLPRMQIAGNASTFQNLRWYVDRWGSLMPRPWAFSVPLWVYRVAMLAWALWLAESLLDWSRWAWKSWTSGGFWER